MIVIVNTIIIVIIGKLEIILETIHFVWWCLVIFIDSEIFDRSYKHDFGESIEIMIKTILKNVMNKW